jgi:hypothetical protein
MLIYDSVRVMSVSVELILVYDGDVGAREKGSLNHD